MDIEVSLKVDLVVRANRAAHRFDPRVKQVMATYADQTKRIWVSNTDGRFAEDTQDLCRLGVRVVAEAKNGDRRSRFYGGGGRGSLSYFGTFHPEQAAERDAQQASVTLGA